MSNNKVGLSYVVSACCLLADFSFYTFSRFYISELRKYKLNVFTMRKLTVVVAM